MAKDEEKTQNGEMERINKFMIQQIKSGADKRTIVLKLVEMGMNESEVTPIVEQMHAEIIQTAEREQFAPGAVIPALIGGLIAALIGGRLWSWVVILTGYEIGYMAIGIGFLSGFAVVLAAQGKKGVLFQIVAVLSSLLGILISKYMIFFHYFRQAIGNEYGQEAASNISFISEGFVQFFLAKGLKSMVSGFDILWIILAVTFAWGIPKGMGIKLDQVKRV